MFPPQVLTGLKQLRPEVLRSREVQFALAVFNAYQLGNWAKFFQLAAAAPYVPACLMHFFFNPMRARALRLLNACGSKGDQLPLDSMAAALLMDSVEDLGDLCAFHGLTVSSLPDGREVLLVKASSFITPQDALPRARSQVVASKAQATRREDVLNRPAPSAWPVPSESLQFLAAAQSPRPRARFSPRFKPPSSSPSSPLRQVSSAASPGASWLAAAAEVERRRGAEAALAAERRDLNNKRAALEEAQREEREARGRAEEKQRREEAGRREREAEAAREEEREGERRAAARAQAVVEAERVAAAERAEFLRRREEEMQRAEGERRERARLEEARRVEEDRMR
jgi:hypothetical protein